jgi:hypothetical protein
MHSFKERKDKQMSTLKINSNQAQLIKTIFAQFGKIGGSSTSEAKRRAGKINAQKARAVRMAKLGKGV